MYEHQPDPVPAYDPYGGWPPPPPPTRRTKRRGIATAAALATAGALVAGAAVLAVNAGATIAGSGTALARVPNADRLPQNGYPGYGFPNSGSGSSSGNGTASTASTAQSRGVVDINTVLGYQQASAAGTGMVVTPSGEVLTNNHVVDGATQITVTVVSTGKTYSASVVGTDASDDVAVLQLSGASGLQTASFGDSSTVTVGAAVTGVGNAGGAGGTPSAASGHVTALDQQLTATDDTGGNAETLTGMIETDAPIQAGDSGGPLYDTGSGKIVGMDTAAATNGRVTTAAYAIPIDKALSIASQIESGQASSTIHIGSTGFLGVSVANTSTGGAAIAGVVQNGPAANAGIAAGDVITQVGGTPVGSAAELRSVLAQTKPGQQVSVVWTDSAGQAHRATVTLITGPAS